MASTAAAIGHRGSPVSPGVLPPVPSEGRRVSASSLGHRLPPLPVGVDCTAGLGGAAGDRLAPGGAVTTTAGGGDSVRGEHRGLGETLGRHPGHRAEAR